MLAHSPSGRSTSLTGRTRTGWTGIIRNNDPSTRRCEALDWDVIEDGTGKVPKVGVGGFVGIRHEELVLLVLVRGR